MLEHLGLVVHAIPGHVERFGEVELEQPVVADDLQRDALAVAGELDAAVAHVGHEPELVELACTIPEADAAVTPRRSARALVVTGPPRGAREGINRLRVVLNCG